MTDTPDNAPERIWAVGLWNSEPGNWTGGHWDLHQDFSGDVEYRRADLPATDAQIMARIKPLVWKTQSYKSPEQIGHHADGYSIYESPKTGKCVVSSGSPYFFGPVHEDTIEAAQADYVARIMSALTTGDSND
jgi:hypothetical protein